MCRQTLARLVMVGALIHAVAFSAGAVSLQDMKGFEALFGRYGPKGDCSKYPQVLIDARGMALDHGQGKVERAPTLDYSASFFGPEYEGDAHAFFPYMTDAGPNPLLVLVNDERPGSLRVEPHDYGWKGGPPMPARFQPWLAGSPYARCAAD